MNQKYCNLPVYIQQPVGQPGRQSQHCNCICVDLVVVHIESGTGAAWRKTLVPDVPVAGTGRMVFPQKPDRCQIYPGTV